MVQCNHDDWAGQGVSGDLNVCKMTYVITQHTRRRAKQHGVVVKPSSKKNKKTDGKVMASVGDKRYPDFGTYLKMEAKNLIEKGTADNRRRAYKARHGGYPRGSAGFWAGELLW